MTTSIVARGVVETKGVFLFFCFFFFFPGKEKENKEVKCQEEEGSSLVLQMVPGGPGVAYFQTEEGKRNKLPCY